MKVSIQSRSGLAAAGALMAFASATQAATFASPFYGDAPDDHHPWAVHDGNRPQPKIVTPGSFSSPEQPGKPPSDAIVLFDGADLSKWESPKDGGTPARWSVKDGIVTVVPGTGDIRTKEKFGDCQLHIEWAAPKEVKGDSQGRANSGLFMMGRVEIQILDSYNNITYADGHAGSVYGVNPPMANAIRPPGEFQVYDVVFRRPIYKDGKVLDPGYATVFVNGVLVQDHTPLEGGTGHMGRTKPGSLGQAGPLQLQDHNNPMRFRNIWYRPLPPRSIEGGTDGYLSIEATLAKRKETATTLRAEAAKPAASPLQEMYRWMESLVYEKDEAAMAKATQLATTWVAGLKDLPAASLASKKDDARHLRDVLNYLAKFKIIAPDFAPKADLEKIIKDQAWDKKKA